MNADLERGEVPVKYQNAALCITKTIIIVLCSLFCLPFGITSIYFAFIDKSCVNLDAGNLYVNLKDFLAVDGVCILIYYVYTVAFILFTDGGSNNILIKIILKVSAAFSLSWSIVGAIIFWSLIDNTRCERPIYNYVFALLVLKFIGTLCSQLGSDKK